MSPSLCGTTGALRSAAAATGALLLLGACGPTDPSSPTSAADSAAASSTASATASATPSAGSDAGATRAAGAAAVPGSVSVARPAPRPLRPVRIRIPALGVDATVTELGIGRGGAIDVPADPAQAGWLDTTPAPGQRGPAVVAGHVDSTSGPAVFYRLGRLAVGDAVVVTRRDGREVTFTVDGVRTYAKRAFPTREVYGPVPGPALRLITCGGDYLRGDGGYQANVVVYAS